MKKSVVTSKKSSGPSTEKGKLISSQNAIKGGLTTQQLLNQPELERYNQLVNNLTAHYATSNPLVPLQIERIARMQIQLERIQNAIDALYRQSELNPPQKLQKDYSQTDSTVLEMKFKLLIGIFDKSFFEKIQNTLTQIQLKKILFSLNQKKDDGNEFKEGKGPEITQNTLLGAYLFAEAAFYNVDVTNYLKDKLSAITNSRTTRELYEIIKFEVLHAAIDIFESPDMTNFITTDDYYEFYQFQNWFEREIAKIPDQIEEILQSTKEAENQLNVPFPKFDELDRLMRYQTALSRQLSTAIGELLVLAK
jgi:hypothetical protein